MTTTFYHVTTDAAWHSIQKTGLVPAIGPRSEEMGESYPMICLFTSEEALNDGLGNWLGEYFEDEMIHILAVDMEGVGWHSNVEWEAMVLEPIPVSHIAWVRSE